MKIIIINGLPKSGKDTFVHLCKTKTAEVILNLSTVDFVKEVATMCGWDKTKTPKNRAFLCDLKNLLTKWDDVPLKDIKNKIAAFRRIMKIDGKEDSAFVFIHCREPEEIAKLVTELGAKTLLIQRDEVASEIQSNDADANVLNYNYDYVISNNGTIEELEVKAKDFIKQMKEV